MGRIPVQVKGSTLLDVDSDKVLTFSEDEIRRLLNHFGGKNFLCGGIFIENLFAILAGIFVPV